MLSLTKLTTESVNWDELVEDLNFIPDEIKIHLLKIMETLRTEQNEQFNIHWVESALLRTESCLDRIWETLNSGYWKNVPIEYRYAYTFCSLIKAVLLEMQSQLTSENLVYNQKNLEKIICQIDKGLLLGAPLPQNSTVLTKIASQVNAELFKITPKPETSTSSTLCIEEISTIIFPGFEPISDYFEPSMETFYTDIFVPKVPAVLKGCMKHWRALDLWSDTDYLKKAIGTRTVPIEIGSRYTEENWSQTLVTFSEFLQKHIHNKTGEVGYLAQHQLFEQVPELKEDFSIPDYCSFSDKNDNDHFPDVNAWFGPSDTVSPLHFDPKNNLLCQVIGCKRIVLYHPNDISNLYPYESRMLNNTAQVDPYRPDDAKFPRFRKAKGYMCFLKPGDMLFIPPKWWHHVVSLSPSFSISFWWD